MTPVKLIEVVAFLFFALAVLRGVVMGAKYLSIWLEANDGSISSLVTYSQRAKEIITCGCVANLFWVFVFSGICVWLWVQLSGQ